MRLNVRTRRGGALPRRPFPAPGGSQYITNPEELEGRGFEVRTVSGSGHSCLRKDFDGFGRSHGLNQLDQLNRAVAMRAAR